jgi:hypothetical protein
MSEQHYDIFFRGETQEGFELTKVKANVGQLFKASPEKVEQLFSGKVVALRKNLDKATAAKFKHALESAGAKIYIKLAAAAVAATPIPAASASIDDENEPIPKADVSTDDSNTEFVLLPPGSDVLRDDERHAFVPVEIDISDIRLASVFDITELDNTPPPPAPDVSHITTAPVGADILEGVTKEPPPEAPNVEHISIAEAGADLAELVEKMMAPPAPDVSHLSTAQPGADLLEGIEKPKAPPAPDVSHINLV